VCGSLTDFSSGSPALVANLWDVTDRDIDRLSKAMFTKLGLSPSPSPTAGGTSPRPNDDRGLSMSIPKALAEARSECTMRYLNGAAPVVYGVPVRFLAMDHTR
jgi:separase